MQPRTGMLLDKGHTRPPTKEKNMTETAQGSAVVTPPKSTYSSGTPYYPRTDTEYGIRWNDGEVTKATGLTPEEAIKWFMNSIKLARIGVRSKDFYATGIVSRTIEKNGAVTSEWVEGEWGNYTLTREDMLRLYRLG